MNDTLPEISKRMHDMIRALKPERRLKMGCSMNKTSRFLVMQAILERDPNISKTDLRKEIFLKFYENDFDQKSRDKILNFL